MPMQAPAASRPPTRRRLLLIGAAALTCGIALAGVPSAIAQPQPSATRSAPTHDNPTPGQLTLPAPTGPYRVGTIAVHLVDAARTDPWIPPTPPPPPTRPAS
jgi:hypothetical protein